MLDIIDVNQKVFDYLEHQRALNPKLKYTFRKSNYNNRLNEGYWFYGTEKYLAISFWSGMDWKNRTPNISFIIFNTGETRLEINVSDSDHKRKFIQTFLLEKMTLGDDGRRYIKRYSIEELAYLDVLDLFLNGFNGEISDKKIIDDIIDEHSKRFFKDQDSGNQIGFIDHNEFRARLNKIEKYKQLKEYAEYEEENILSRAKPSKLAYLKLKNYGIINEIEINDIPYDNQWIFITGENGSGKTNLLRGIATGLGYRVLKQKEIHPNKPYHFEAKFSSYSDEYKRSGNEGVKSQRRPICSGLAMYGPYRLDIVKEKINTVLFLKELNKNGSFKSLFETGIPLLNFEKQFSIWSSKKKEQSKFEKRKYFITSVFTDIVPNLYNIKFESDAKGAIVAKYVVRESDITVEKEFSWDELSSGTKSVFALIGDIMIRLYDQQKDIVDPSELSGIVLIDEIDLHLHPKAQKEIVINLSKAFPNVQFIATTHSPIPLLGANKSSKILLISREKETKKSLEIKDLSYIPFYSLLPNALFSSPIFGFSNLTSEFEKNANNIRTENTYREVVYNTEIKKRLNNLIDKLESENEKG